MKYETSHGHFSQMTCHPTVHTDQCREKVNITLACYHTVEVDCATAQLGSVICTQMVQKVLPRCGHTVQLECHKDPTTAHCQEPCNTALKCDHLCKGKCYDCHNGRLHIECDERENFL